MPILVATGGHTVARSRLTHVRTLVQQSIDSICEQTLVSESSGSGTGALEQILVLSQAGEMEVGEA